MTGDIATSAVASPTHATSGSRVRRIRCRRYKLPASNSRLIAIMSANPAGGEPATRITALTISACRIRPWVKCAMPEGWTWPARMSAMSTYAPA